MARFAELTAALAAAERWLLPPECLLCRQPVPLPDHDALACGVCRSRWRPVPAPWCHRCGHPLDGEDGCGLCAQWPAAIGRVRSAVLLEDGAREAVHLLKYEGWWRMADSLATPMRTLEPLTGGVCLIPVPLSAARARERGYNQAERLARALGRITRLSVRAELLARTRHTPTQTTLPPDARRANVAGAFAATGVRDIRAVLVDDVFTTGATLLAAAEALAAGGAASVDAVTFARALG
ncbi:MAG TPA: double zinc ribbon domain-containing protein [Gemmatimonadales bacterium]|nr:double zinc ribbon domain-containing protein [Gemmatimonadales bacterium]